MITVLVLHVIAPENRAQAEALIARNTADSKRARGFLSRRILYSVDDPLLCYSITSWRTQADLEAFRARPDRPSVEIEGEERRIYELTGSDRRMLFTRSETKIFSEPDAAL
jgi:heme-degrading monooxygenase HmoA